MKNEKIMFYLLLLLAFTLPLTESGKNFALILFILVGFYATYKKEIIPKFDLLNTVIILMPIVIIAGSYYAINTLNTIKGTSSLITMAILFIYIRELKWSEKNIQSLIMALFLGFTITLFWGYYDLVYQGAKFLQLHSVGFVNHSSIYIFFIFITSLIYLNNKIKTLPSYKSIFIIVVCFLAIISVFITGSRATMYTSILLIAIFGIYSLFKLDKKILLFLGLIVISILMLFLFNIDQYTTDKFQKGIFSNDPRLNLAISFFKTWINHDILFGIGINNSGFINLKEFYVNSIYEHMSHAHNTYLTYLVERGIVGLTLYMVFIISLFVKLIKKLIIEPNNPLLLISIIIWIANFIISFANTTFHHENAILMLMIWSVSLVHIKDKDVSLSNRPK